MAYVNPVPDRPAAGAWYLATAARAALDAPAAPAAGLWLVVGCVPAVTRPAGRVRLVTPIAPAQPAPLGDWSAPVDSEVLPVLTADGSAGWRWLWVTAATVPPEKGLPVLEDGLPRDCISLPVLAAAVGADGADAAALAALAGLRDQAVAQVHGSVDRSIPAAAFQAAVCRLVGYLLDRPSSAASAWRASGAASACAEWVSP
ncbi:MAG: hypothetical protein OXJ62_00015 [Spirochaetaceae bacterium]|nr:hypothetical protein [Spirochaetaceae bacterium]